ncbi:hypothetical protein FV292_26655, partial [Escherichia coli]|uniref:hypothetical protein n=1 Tax=Escherichia coli TaxID=562 RepID=UPI0011DBFCA5
MAADPASPRASSMVERVPRATSKRPLLVLAAIGLVVVALFAWLVARAQDEPPPQTATVQGELPWSVAGWRGEQLVSAATVIQAGRDLGAADPELQGAVRRRRFGEGG